MVSNGKKILLIEQAIDVGENLLSTLSKPVDQSFEMYKFVRKAGLELEEDEEVVEIHRKLQEVVMELEVVLDHLESKLEDLERELT